MLTGKELAKFVESKIGTPYVFGAKGDDGVLTQERVNALSKTYYSIFTTVYLRKIVNKKLIGQVCTDCSGLISWYTGKEIGSAQMYASAVKKMPISDIENFPIGTVLWRKGHVGVYIGCGYCVEAKGIDYGTVKSAITDCVFTHGLLFSELNYDMEIITTDKGKNIYPEPTGNLKKGDKNEFVKWLQWELVESGYALEIDGDFGVITDITLRTFQKSCKIKEDGVCGVITRRYLKMLYNVEQKQSKVIDVSSYQKTIDWKKVKSAKVQGAILKIINKKAEADTEFENNYSGCTKVLMPVCGVYHYSYATSVDLAVYYANMILLNLKGRKLKVFLDVEDDCQKNIGMLLIDIINTYKNIIEGAGYEFAVYTGLDFYKNYIKPFSGKIDCDFWIARYPSNKKMLISQNPSDNYKPIIDHNLIGWQYSSKGSVSGITGNVDLNIMYV